MHQYIVMIACTMDNFPVGIFTDRDEAVKFASNIEGGATNNPLLAAYEDYQDISSIIGVQLVTFIDGKPTKQEWIKDFEC